MTEVPFVETSVSRQILQAIDFARETHKCAAIVGAALHVDGVVSVLEIARREVGTRTIRARDLHAALDTLPHFRQTISRHTTA